MDFKYKTSFYILLGGAITIFIGSGFYFIRLFINNKKIKKLAPPNQTLTNKNNSSKIGLEIYAKISKGVEEYLEKVDTPQIKLERRKILLEDKNNLEYRKIISKYIIDKSMIYEDIKTKVLAEFNYSKEEFEKIIIDVTNIQIEQAFFNIYTPQIQKPYPTKEKTKDIYLYHCNKILEFLKSQSYKRQSPDEKNYHMLLERIKIDDEIYFNFGYTFTQIKYLINYYNLYQDEDVKYFSETLQS